MDRSLLEKKQLAELREIASTLELKGFQRMKKADLVDLIIGAAAEASTGDDGKASSNGDASSEGDDDTSSKGDKASSKNDDASSRAMTATTATATSSAVARTAGGNQQDLDDAEVREGVLDLLPEGYGFLRTTGYLSGHLDVYVSQSYVRRFHLRRGDRVRGPIRSNNRGNDKFPALARVDAIEGIDVDEHLEDDRPVFADLTPVFPDQRIPLDGADAPVGARLVDLLAPLGRGQRGLVVAPPRAGRTTVLRELATAIEAGDPDVDVLVLLVDERPEEITDFERAIDGEVVASPFDNPAEDHTAVAELALERAKRLVERGRNVVLLLDSATRLCRAYDLASQGSGRTLAGGLDAAALHPVKRFLGAARNVEDGGSLTIVATVLDTASPADVIVRDELASVATMHLYLDGGLARRGVFPAFDLARSGTHREELLRDPDELEAARAARAAMADRDPAEVIEAAVARVGDEPSTGKVLRMLADDLG